MEALPPKYTIEINHISIILFHGLGLNIPKLGMKKDVKKDCQYLRFCK